jgi:hypothetical protein
VATDPPRIEAGKIFELPDGTKISPRMDGPPDVKSKEEQDIEEELDDVLEDPFASRGTAFIRTLADIKAEYSEFKTVMLVLSINMWGLDVYGIARVLNRDVTEIQSVMDTALFGQLRKEIVEAIRYAETGSIMGYLESKSYGAAVVIAKGMKSKSEDTRITSAKDILDRTGFRPVDRTEHVHRFEDDMRIVYVEERPVTPIEIE